MPDIPEEKPKRRPRYRGTHPRRFHEKYKEHDPARYAEDVGKILASGKTPAGSHRPIMVREILDALAPQPGDIAVDATLGYGGHATELLKAVLPGGRLIAVDADPIELPKTEARLRTLGFPDEALTICRSNYAGLPKVLAAASVSGADVLLADLGLSSMQIDDPSRGFTFKHAGPLDLRMNPQRGQPASAFLSTLDPTALSEILDANADEPHARLLAGAIVDAAKRKHLATTSELASIIARTLEQLPGQRARDEVQAATRRVFQAIRIAVNDEFGALEMFLRQLPACLRTGGRVAILTFHSGEDRRVKQAFKEGLRAGIYTSISDEVTRPGSEELRANPRSAPAKLRRAVRA